MPATCLRHPRYKARRKPETQCGSCWAIWLTEHPSETDHAAMDVSVMGTPGRDTGPQLVRAQDVAEALGQTVGTIYAMARKGIIPSYAAGPTLRGRRFDIEEVRQVLKTLAQKQK